MRGGRLWRAPLPLPAGAIPWTPLRDVEGIQVIVLAEGDSVFWIDGLGLHQTAVSDGHRVADWNMQVYTKTPHPLTQLAVGEGWVAWVDPRLQLRASPRAPVPPTSAAAAPKPAAP
jgi:hypothetical protein